MTFLGCAANHHGLGMVSLQSFQVDNVRQLKKLLDQPQTTSLELVQLLNALRDANAPRLRHDHFMRKVPSVLGDRARKFEATYESITGGTHPCYEFPKREACLMKCVDANAWAPG